MQNRVFNSFKTGLISGLALPVIFLALFYFNRYREIPVDEFMRFIYFRDILAPLLSLNILPNLVIFYLFIRKDFLESARGVVLATFLFAGIVLLFKVMI